MIEKKNRKRHRLLIVSIFIISLISIYPVVSAIFLDDLEDVETGTAINCNFLHYNGTMWTNYDLWNESIIWYKQHTFNNNITFNNITAINVTAIRYYGDGGNLTGISGITLPSYLNTVGHPHNQDLNMSNNVIFNNITSSANISASYNISVEGIIPNCKFIIGNISTSRYGILGVISSTAIRLTGLGVIRSLELCGSSDEISTTLADVIIDDIGAVTITKQPSTRVRLLNTQSIPSLTWTKLTLTVNDYDLNNNWVDALYRFVVSVAGLYQISYSVTVTGLNDADSLESAIYKNGIRAGGYEKSTTGVVSDLGNSGNDILYLNINDYIELYTQHDFGANRNFANAIYTNYLSICKIA
jgi:hypothetical protein